MRDYVVNIYVTTLQNIIGKNPSSFSSTGKFRPRSHGTGSVWSPYQFEESQD